MPRVFEELFEDTGAPLDVELVRVEPVTRYRFADGSSVELQRRPAARRSRRSRRGRRVRAATGRASCGTCAAMWRASVPFLTGPPPWPPRRPAPGDPTPDPRDFLRVRPWHTLRTLARAHARDPAAADGHRALRDVRRRRPAARARRARRRGLGRARVRRVARARRDLPRSSRRWSGGCCRSARERALRDAGRRAAARRPAGDRREHRGGPRRGGRGRVGRRRARRSTGSSGARPGPSRERSLSGFALMLGLRGTTEGLVHHAITFPADYDAEFDDVFRRAPARARPDALRQRVVRDGSLAGARRRARTGSCSSTRPRARA